MSRILIIIICVLTAYSSFAGDTTRYDIVVATDSSGDFTRIQDAINSCRGFMDREKTIYVKSGIYNEKVTIHSYLTHITIIGESAQNTIITYSDHNGLPGIGTFNSYTLQVLGNNTTLVI